MQSFDTLSGPSELGSLIAHSSDESQFVGSSSGVFFVNTVRQAFAKSLGPLDDSPASMFPAPEDTIVEPPESPMDKQYATKARATAESPTRWTYDTQVAHLLGEAPGLEDARRLMIMYFKLWHPLFPFLYGPSFLRAMEAFYSESPAGDCEFSSTMSEHSKTCWTTIFQSIFNISSLLQTNLELPQKSKVKSNANALKMVDVLLHRQDILSLQALLALQLYLVARMSLRNASLLGGAILRSILHAGLHRCPYRYKQLNSHDGHLRKRIFWCFYAIDRYLSQALGLPLGIQDSDIDVCLPGAVECHIPGSHRSISSFQLEGASRQITNDNIESSSSRGISSNHGNTSREGNLNQEATLAGYVMYGKLTGKALELFHKSIGNREVRRSAVLFLVSDVHKWWNTLPSDLQGTDDRLATDIDEESSFDLSPFFSILYEHLILCINRPCLSLEIMSPDFCSGLQICISSARNILKLLKRQLAKGQALFWPGLLSAAYMAGLVIAFACQLGQYPLSKGCHEISNCRNILQVMCRQWEIAKHCHTALSFLLLNIQRKCKDQDTASAICTGSKRTHGSLNSTIKPTSAENKRTKSSSSLAGQEDNNANQAQSTEAISINNTHASETPKRTWSDHESNQFSSSIPSEPGNNISTRHMYEMVANEDSTNQLSHSHSQDQQEQQHQPTFSPLVPDINYLEDPQWLDDSSFLTTTNFDLNMTDLFQNSAWDPMVFGPFTNNQTPQN